MNVLDIIEIKKVERMKDLLSYSPNQRTEKMLLEIMAFTKVFF